MQWLVKNKEWLFSGIGVVMITTLAGLVFRRLKRRSSVDGQSQSVYSKGNQNFSGAALANQISGPRGKNITAVTYHHHEGLEIEDVRKLALTLHKQNFPELRREARNEAARRIESYLAELGRQRLQENLSADQFTRFKLPEIQYSFNQSLEAVAIMTAPDLRRTLADLVVKRVSTDSESLEAIVYGEAIKTVSKLTPEMLNILALKVYFLLGFKKIESWDDLKNAHTRHISPLLGFSDSIINFQHLAYAGCGTLESVAFAPSGLIGLLRRVCPNLFQRSVSAEQVGYLNLQPKLAESLFKSDSDGKYRFRCTSIEQVREICSGSEHNESRALAAVPNLFEAILDTEAANRDLLLKKLPGFDLAFKLVSTTLANLFRLSSVGLAIGAIHLEAKTGLRVEVNFQSPLPEPELEPPPSELF